ncbi:heme-binding protein 2 [Embiotoca jacksoni]|uniref:heme-binding protein 2 n=1 Tax=Embiotoca jacksoni TaxID=100190 RepID=UPI003703B70A
MIYLPGLVGFLLVLTAEAKVGDSSQVEFCSETEECLLFDLICETETYEVRHYDSVKWVSTEETYYYMMEFASYKAFRRLFDYITGGNENGQKINMTAPVVMKMHEKKGGFFATNRFTMSFLLPSDCQKNPPKPTDEKVYIHDTPDMNVYVRSYGGWMTTFSDRKHADSLSSDLDLVNANYEQGFHLAVGYNSPMTMFNRHNEVWFLAEDDPVCPSSEEMD